MKRKKEESMFLKPHGTFLEVFVRLKVRWNIIPTNVSAETKTIASEMNTSN